VDEFEEVANAVRFVQAVLGGKVEEWQIKDGLTGWGLEARPRQSRYRGVLAWGFVSPRGRK
jgi:hypothetical protein